MSAILSSFSDSMKLAEEATNANGSALENQEKYMESFSGRMQGLTTEAKIAAINVLNSDTLKGVLDILTEIVKVFGQFVDKIGLLGTAGIGVGLFRFFKNFAKPCNKGDYKLPTVFSWANIDKEMIKWFIVQVYALGVLK